VQEFQIIPHVGIGPIRLGASRADARISLAIAGFPLKLARGKVDFFCDSSIQVEYDDSDSIQFIGISCDPSYRLTYEGVNVFDITAPELFARVASQDGSGDHKYRDTEYLFPNQMVTLWDADEQYDRLAGKKRVIWAQVGLGNRKYVDDCEAIDAPKTDG